MGHEHSRPTHAWVASSLGEALAPSVFVYVETMPQTPNGKVDRSALPAPGRSRPRLETRLVPPRTPVEATLARIWAEALGLDEVGVEDDFLDLGGTSLVAGRITSRVCDRFGVTLPAAVLLASPRVADMATALVEHLPLTVEPDARHRLVSGLEDGHLVDGRDLP